MQPVLPAEVPDGRRDNARPEMLQAMTRQSGDGVDTFLTIWGRGRFVFQFGDGVVSFVRVGQSGDGVDTAGDDPTVVWRSWGAAQAPMLACPGCLRVRALAIRPRLAAARAPRVRLSAVLGAAGCGFRVSAHRGFAFRPSANPGCGECPSGGEKGPWMDRIRTRDASMEEIRTRVVPTDIARTRDAPIWVPSVHLFVCTPMPPVQFGDGVNAACNLGTTIWGRGQCCGWWPSDGPGTQFRQLQSPARDARRFGFCPRR